MSLSPNLMLEAATFYHFLVNSFALASPQDLEALVNDNLPSGTPGTHHLVLVFAITHQYFNPKYSSTLKPDSEVSILNIPFPFTHIHRPPISTPFLLLRSLICRRSQPTLNCIHNVRKVCVESE